MTTMLHANFRELYFKISFYLHKHPSVKNPDFTEMDNSNPPFISSIVRVI
jgi:hypothetical protein